MANGYMNIAFELRDVQCFVMRVVPINQILVIKSVCDRAEMQRKGERARESEIVQ